MFVTDTILMASKVLRNCVIADDWLKMSSLSNWKIYLNRGWLYLQMLDDYLNEDAAYLHKA
jgi:hypothetical protein